MTEIRVGHVMDELRSLEADRFQCVVTSPPYFNLRVYHTDPQVWGGEVGCEHEWEDRAYYRVAQGEVSSSRTWGASGSDNAAQIAAARNRKDSTCRLCGCWRGELGAEPEPDLYIAHLLEVFAEVKRVLRPDGIAFVNIGDSYSGSGKGGQPEKYAAALGVKAPPTRCEVAAKSLCLIPERLALGLLGQGWIIRNRLAWRKKNSMPVSADDRLKGTWEHVYMLAKGQRYKFDLGALKVPGKESSKARASRANTSPGKGRYKQHGWSGALGQSFPNPVARDRVNPGDFWEPDLWNILEVNSQPRHEEHYAAFPDKFVELLLLASTDPGDEVLDPFVGRGTTVIVAQQLGRRGLGIELNPTYAKLAEANIRREASQEVMAT